MVAPSAEDILLTCSPDVADEHGPTRRNLLVEGRYLCRREGIERKGAGNDLTLVEALAPAERADLAAMRSQEGAPSGGA
jgi:hypothetical protein